MARAAAFCLENLGAAEDGDTNTPRSCVVVHLEPYSHFYHDSCIRAWFTSTRPERGTCPNCRKALFIPDRLTAQQIASMFEEERSPSTNRLPYGPHRELGPDEVLVDWTTYNMDHIIIRRLREERAGAYGRRRRTSFINVCRMTVTELIAAADTPLRNAFDAHHDDYLPLQCAHRMILWLTSTHPRVHRELGVDDLHHQMHV
ncbi:hypothetical protein K458DRAFT_406586 [Lentithecium fluviatile CBS 122367]|uniref:RING-type domain-containing protein n=1 Tax=Lentithecium fluviatile CBS 122367 TaxID=1168545 RepID=A0A6G1ITE5_9PLEO|nr:hypothetical protein K458DRAFT_406586 [Lentithecium fluviatile CBS 122367]